MALGNQKPTVHNQMLGSKIQHPPSTNFHDDEFETPKAKRLKRSDSADKPLSRRNASISSPDSDSESYSNSIPDDSILIATTPARKEVPDSEAEEVDDDDDDEVAAAVTSSQTDLEAALPSVKTDREAIAEYEATRAAGRIDADLQDRLGRRVWIQGKSSIYVDAFNLALETVLEEEAHLFDEAELALFSTWRDLSYEGQYL